jgi:hypothetical protein
MLGDFGNLEHKIRYLIHRVLILPEHIISIVRQEVTHLIIPLVTNNLKAILLRRYDISVAIGHLKNDLLHQFMQLVKLVDHLLHCLLLRVLLVLH